MLKNYDAGDHVASEISCGERRQSARFASAACLCTEAKQKERAQQNPCGNPVFYHSQRKESSFGTWYHFKPLT
jgi:hypothetical protein